MAYEKEAEGRSGKSWASSYSRVVLKSKAAQRERRDSVSSAVSVRAVVPVALVCVLVLLQGGYYAGATCAVALVSTAAYVVWHLAWKERMTCDTQSLLILGLACIYLASSLVHSAAATELLETATWFAIAGMSLWCIFGTREEKQKALEYMAWSGVILAIVGILMYFGLLPVEGSVSAGRLMFTFQYANTAGLFFGIVSVLCLCALRGRRRAVAVIPAAALVLTQSVGSMAVFLVALVAVGIRCAYVEKPRREIVAGVAGAVVVTCVAGVLLLHDRFAQAASTFAERIVQVLDASSVFAGNLAFGIGPDQWQVVYPAVQTAQYRAADVHCSYMQVGLDAGVLALVVLVAFFAVGIARLVKAGDFTSTVCAVMIVVHALVDFDLMFSSVMLIACLVMSLSQLEGKAEGQLRGWATGGGGLNQAFGLCVAACALVASVGGIYLDGQVGVLQERADQGDGEGAYALLESRPYLRSDVLMQGQVAAALFFQGEYESIASLSADASSPSEEILLYSALSKLASGSGVEAREALTDVLYRHPYDVELYQAVRAYLMGLAPGDSRAECIASYNEQADRANALALEGHAAWIGKQEEIELIGSDDA